MGEAVTLLQRLWADHVVVSGPDRPDTIWLDLHLLHDAGWSQPFAELVRRGVRVRRPDLTVAVTDHLVSTELGRRANSSQAFEEACIEHQLPFIGPQHPSQGIVHVMSPELGFSQPGMTIACGDSHTSTHGALGCLTFALGSTQVGHVLATQTLLAQRPAAMAIRLDGEMALGVTAKDLALELARRTGSGGASGYAVEFLGTAVARLDMEARMTISNMTTELGAQAGLFAADAVTFDYLQRRPYAPRGPEWERALDRWRSARGDPEAMFERELNVDLGQLEPMITYGTTPAMSMPITQQIPAPDDSDPHAAGQLERSLKYMGLQAGQPLLGHPIDVVFIGSCTNGRLSDLRAAAGVLDGRRVADRVRMVVVPGSETVRRAAEAEGLDDIFRKAGAEWHQSGCSMCVALNGDHVDPGRYAVSTTNRNFQGRQGPGARTLLASPATAAACAVSGVIADPRELDR